MSEPSGASAFLAKITRPAYGEIVCRERLLQRLDESREPLTWIAAPPGAGKTTLAAIYVGVLSGGDAPLARRYLDRMESVLTMSRPMDTAMYHYHSAWYELSQGRAAAAGEFARVAVGMAEQAGARFPAAVMRNDLGRVLSTSATRRARLRSCGRRATKAAACARKPSST